jgi:HlyD family secretion protein
MRDADTEALRLVSLPSWLWLLVLILTLGSGIAYGIFGVVTRVVQGVGITRFQLEVLTVASPKAGLVQAVLLEPGANVKFNTPIVELSSGLIATEIEATNQLIAFLKSEHAALHGREQAMVEEARRRRDAAVRESSESGRTAKDLLGLRRHLLTAQERLLDRGLISQETVLESRTTVAALQARIVSARTKSAEAELDAAQLEAAVAGDQANRRGALLEANSRLTTLKEERSQSFIVRSFLAGRVNEIFAQPGEAVEQGQLLARLIPDKDSEQTMKIEAVIPQSLGKELSVGDDVQVVPSFVDKSRYGFMKGRLVWLDTYAAAPEELSLGLTNPTHIMALQEEFGPLLLAEIEIFDDPSTESGFQWSTSTGWPGPIGPGVKCDLQVVFRKDRPIDLLFPWLRSILGQ